MGWPMGWSMLAIPGFRLSVTEWSLWWRGMRSGLSLLESVAASACNDSASDAADVIVSIPLWLRRTCSLADCGRVYRSERRRNPGYCSGRCRLKAWRSKKVKAAEKPTKAAALAVVGDHALVRVGERRWPV